MSIQDVQVHLALLDAAESLEQEEQVFAVAQEELSAEDFSKFTALCPPSRFVND